MTKLDFASQSQEKEETCICGGRKHSSRFRDCKLQEYYLLRASITKCSSRSVEITEIYFLVLWKQTLLLELPRPVLLMWSHVVFLMYTTVTVCLSSDKDVICIGLHSYSFDLILKCSSLWRLDHYCFFFLKGDFPRWPWIADLKQSSCLSLPSRRCCNMLPGALYRTLALNRNSFWGTWHC